MHTQSDLKYQKKRNIKMITIEQLLESVDLGFEPRWVTKDEEGYVELWETEPHKVANGTWSNYCWRTSVGAFKLAEFENKHWTECIYEVPRKTTGKIEKLERHIEMDNDNAKSCPPSGEEFMYKINELVDAVNELKEE